MEVHKHFGSGFLEVAYHKALAIEFTSHNIPFQHEVGVPIFYKGQPLDLHYRADFICYGEIIVEVKAIAQLGSLEMAQLINYLKATNLQIGLLLNFGAKSLQYERYVRTNQKSA